MQVDPPPLEEEVEEEVELLVVIMLAASPSFSAPVEERLVGDMSRMRLNDAQVQLKTETGTLPLTTALPVVGTPATCT